ncbi:HAD family hydrolase [Corynebacterium cystitidis]|uniref:HAD family hydrolase n=1 Tax=Corynebacterium cystitidis TaxID=35757 RepID=UPI00211E9965|nr:HAD family phosphatase [Corynebacterium cystitidis]
MAQNTSATFPFRAIFWDMDGTLIDTEPLWGIATYELSEKLGRRLSAEKREETIGGSFPNTLQVCADWAGVKLVDGDLERYRTWMYERMAQLLSSGVEPLPGIAGLLRSLADAGVVQFVTTNTERVLADYCIDALGRDLFTDTITGDEVPSGKPAPDMYLEAARRVGADPAECLVFEDSWAGMSAAASAGCRVFGLPPEDGPIPDGVVRFDPQQFVDANAEDVATWFQSMG